MSQCRCHRKNALSHEYEWRDNVCLYVCDAMVAQCLPFKCVFTEGTQCEPPVVQIQTHTGLMMTFCTSDSRCVFSLLKLIQVWNITGSMKNEVNAGLPLVSLQPEAELYLTAVGLNSCHCLWFMSLLWNVSLISICFKLDTSLNRHNTCWMYTCCCQSHKQQEVLCNILMRLRRIKTQQRVTLVQWDLTPSCAIYILHGYWCFYLWLCLSEQGFKLSVVLNFSLNSILAT